MTLSVVILAAGKGTRMFSEKPKVLHELSNQPLLQYVINAAKNLKPVNKGDSDLLKAMKLVIKTGKGPKSQIPSMGCNIKWFE